MPTPVEWSEAVREHLGFMEELGFTLEVVEAEADVAAWGPRVRYRSATVALQVHWSLEFDCVDAFVIRLADRQVPEYPVFIRDGDPVDWIHFDLLLDVIGASHRAVSGLDPASVRTQMAEMARLVREHPELLDPSGEIFGSAATRIREVAGRDPAVITVHTPADATPRDAKAAVEEVRRASPGVRVEARRYATRRRP
jgi:hypothetical protein